MKIIRKSRRIKSRYVGCVGDYFSVNYFQVPRVYDDEVTQPDYSFLIKRSAYFLEKNCIEQAIVWHDLALKILKLI